LVYWHYGDFNGLELEMNLRDLRPAQEFAQRMGVKSVVYGPAGSGKTPIINTAPRPLLLATEPGLLSMRGSTVPTYIADTGAKIDDFFKWFFESTETKNFDTIAIDSGTQIAETYLKEAEKTNKHGLAAYGVANANTLKHLETLYFMAQKHVYLIGKQSVEADGSKKPYWPGKELPTKLPHMYDQILHLDIHNVPGVGQVGSFQCAQTFDIMARDRTGMLGQYEEPDFGKLVRKVMS